jgi:hypothetical protein
VIVFPSFESCAVPSQQRRAAGASASNRDRTLTAAGRANVTRLIQRFPSATQIVVVLKLTKIGFLSAKSTTGFLM